jgi:hypothetical protein
MTAFLTTAPSKQDFFFSASFQLRSIPGVDVMIAIFCDFCHFSVKKLAFISKANV